MKYLVLILSIIISIKTVSYGVYEIKKNSNLLRWYYRNNNCYLWPHLSKCYYLHQWRLNIITYILFLMLQKVL